MEGNIVTLNRHERHAKPMRRSATTARPTIVQRNRSALDPAPARFDTWFDLIDPNADSCGSPFCELEFGICIVQENENLT
jgi:hypothetical protein